MAGNPSRFETLRRDAARAFAQTMIVVDDEASQGSEVPHPPPTGTLRTPSRRTTSSAVSANAPTQQGKPLGSEQLALNAKSLIENAMDLGLICSVLRPNKGENFGSRVVKAAQVADIVCLDWEIYEDGGDTVAEIIAAILRQDAKQDGRLRLIAIFTGDSSNTTILDKIFGAIPSKLREKCKINQELLKIESKTGAKIVCLFKAHGRRLPSPLSKFQVSEAQLPERLQIEFAQLSAGLLSNVALATIASIRSSTHHVLSKFTGQMDGPFFHHRALIENPDDAEEYAVEVILSELKGAVDKQKLAANHAGPNAIKARVQDLAGNDETLPLHYFEKDVSRTFDLKADDAARMITDGLDLALKGNKPQNSPKKEIFRRNFSTLFTDSQATARYFMSQFAVLTGVRAHLGSHPYRSGQLIPKLGLGAIIQLIPKLGLGAIIQRKDKTYFMCLQANCDSVRIKGEENFLFVPLDEQDIESDDNPKPEHIVPIPSHRGFKYIGLSTSRKSYSVAQSITFSACQGMGTVNAMRVKHYSGFFFQDKDGNVYRWIADLKQRRALRTVQRLGQYMGRLGFEEFEPYRRG